MIDSRYEKAHAFAKSNFKVLSEAIPPRIQRIEDSIFDRISFSNGSKEKKLELLFREIDIIFDFVNQFTICKEGCSHCCYNLDISISKLEIDWLQSKVDVQNFKKNSDPAACPFLNNDSCSIYEFRPFFCRMHHSLNDSPEWCSSDICEEHSFPRVFFAEVFTLYQYLIDPPSPKNYVRH